MAGRRMGPSVLGSVPGASPRVRASEVVGAGCPVWQAQSESAHEEWGPEGSVFPQAARGRVRVRLQAGWIASRQSRRTVLRSSPTEEV